MPSLNVIKAKKDHIPLQLGDWANEDKKKGVRLSPDAGASIMKDLSQIAEKAYLGSVKIGKEGAAYGGEGLMPAGTAVGKPSTLPEHVTKEQESRDESAIAGKPKPSFPPSKTPLKTPSAKPKPIEHDPDIMTSVKPEGHEAAPKTPSLKPGSTISMQSVAKPKSSPPPIPAAALSGEKKVASMSGSEKGTLQAASAKAFKVLEKSADDQVKHYGKREGTKDPKGSLSRIKPYKTKGGKVKKPPKDEGDKKEMASEMIAHHMHHLGRHPGGEKQAVAIGLNQAGMSRSDKAMNDGSMTAMKSFDELSDLSKAMTARVMPRYPRALRMEREKDIFRSAMDVPTNRDSKIAKDIQSLSAGYLKPDVLAQVRRDEEERTHREMHKSGELTNCGTCGRTFSKSFGDCPTCSISKAAMCKACGHQMVKGRDGQLRCSICG